MFICLKVKRNKRISISLFNSLAMIIFHFHLNIIFPNVVTHIAQGYHQSYRYSASDMISLNVYSCWKYAAEPSHKFMFTLNLFNMSALFKFVDFPKSKLDVFTKEITVI